MGHHEDDRGDWFITASGIKVHIKDPEPENIVLEDIAQALSYTCRFGGHCRYFYSVAQHSVLVSYHVPEELAMAGLLHDAAEAYVGDVIKPLKDQLADLKPIEQKWMEAIYTALWEPGLRLSESDSAAVLKADLEALATERRDLLPPIASRMRWKIDEMSVSPWSERISPELPLRASAMFIARYQELV